MAEKRDIAGLWWLPTNPTDRWVGTLTLEPNKSPKLRVTVQRNAFELIGHPLSAPPVIHGCDQNGQPISLLVPSWPRTEGGMSLCQVEYSAHYAILNLEISRKDEFQVNEFTLRMQHLQGWFGATGFLGAAQNPTEADVCIRFKNPEDESFSVGEDLSVWFRPGYTVHHVLNEQRLHENLCVSFTSKKGMSLSQCKELLNHFRLLLHFATLKENYPLEIKAKKDGHGFTHDAQFYPQDIEIWNSIVKDDVPADWRPDGWVFKFPDVRKTFSDFFANWMKLTGDHEEALNCYCATVYHRLPSSIEHLCLTQALEAYHGVKFTSQKAKNFREKIEVLAKEHKENLQGLVNDAVEFSETVRDNRNYYTHHDPKILKDGRVVSGRKLIRLNEKLKLLFQMCVLTEMGIPAERFQKLRRQLASDIIDLE